jgi:signal transduction histidine kinase
MPLLRARQPIATVIHDASIDDRVVQRTIGPSTRLAIDNERLRVELLTRAHEVRESRARIIAAADASRSEIERNLHDGAQQQLLAASFEVRLARAAADKAGDARLVGHLTTAQATIDHTLVELRDVAQGIHPAVLTVSGLGAAIGSLADHSAVPLELQIAETRYPRAIESVVYRLVRLVVEQADGHVAPVSVDIADRPGGVFVHVIHHGVVLSGDDVAHLQDRIGAVGGTIEVSDHAIGVELPCGS